MGFQLLGFYCRTTVIINTADHDADGPNYDIKHDICHFSLPRGCRTRGLMILFEVLGFKVVLSSCKLRALAEGKLFDPVGVQLVAISCFFDLSAKQNPDPVNSACQDRRSALRPSSVSPDPGKTEKRRSNREHTPRKKL